MLGQKVKAYFQLKEKGALSSVAHTLKLEQYREDAHGPCVSMTHKFVKRFIVFASVSVFM